MNAKDFTSTGTSSGSLTFRITCSWSVAVQFDDNPEFARSVRGGGGTGAVVHNKYNPLAIRRLLTNFWTSPAEPQYAPSPKQFRLLPEPGGKK